MIQPATKGQASEPADEACGRDRFLSTVALYARLQSKILFRLKTPMIFTFVVPILLSVILGPSVSGLADGQPFRAMMGFAVMFSFMVVNYAGLAFFDEYADHTSVRQALYTPSKLGFISGKLLPPCALSLVQLVGFWMFGAVFFDLPLGWHELLLVPTAAFLVATGAGIGTMLFGLTKTPQTFQSLTYLVLICGAALGGAIVAPSRLPVGSQVAGLAMPHRWAMQVFDELTNGSGDLVVVGRSIGVLAVMAAVSLLLGARLIDYRAEKFVTG